MSVLVPAALGTSTIDVVVSEVICHIHAQPCVVVRY